jgi:hypothetical protein
MSRSSKSKMGTGEWVTLGVAGLLSAWVLWAWWRYEPADGGQAL